MKKIKFYLKRIYRLTLSYKMQEELFWKELKKLHIDENLNHGIFEKEKYIETRFELNEAHVATYYYMIYDGEFHCRTKILENYPIELTTDIFILATHFNNLLFNGVVKVNVQNRYIEFDQKRDLIIPVLFSSETYVQMRQHYNISKDIYNAYQRLVVEQEAPAIIIADLLKESKSKENESKQ